MNGTIVGASSEQRPAPALSPGDIIVSDNLQPNQKLGMRAGH